MKFIPINPTIPIPLFFNFELQGMKSKQFIFSIQENVRKFAISKISYHLKNQKLIIGNGSMTVQCKVDKKLIDEVNILLGFQHFVDKKDNICTLFLSGKP